MAKKSTLGGKKNDHEPSEIRTSRQFGLTWDIFKDAVENGVATNDLSGFGHVLLALLFAEYPKPKYQSTPHGPYDKPLREKYGWQLCMRPFDICYRSIATFPAAFDEGRRARHYDFMEALALRTRIGRTMLHV